MIVLFTDYGLNGPYLGQVKSVLHQLVPGEKVIILFADLPRQVPKAAAYLLAAYAWDFPKNTVFFCVVDPGVGTFQDKPVALNLADRWFVGPNNGLFDVITRKTKIDKCLELTWRPQNLSASFHGRDLYAPVCAQLKKGELPSSKEFVWQDQHSWPDDLFEIIYIDNFGNAMTGIRASTLSKETVLGVNTFEVKHASTFADVAVGQGFWYENANGLVEMAVNQRSAAEKFNLLINQEVKII